MRETLLAEEGLLHLLVLDEDDDEVGQNLNELEVANGGAYAIALLTIANQNVAHHVVLVTEGNCGIETLEGWVVRHGQNGNLGEALKVSLNVNGIALLIAYVALQNALPLFGFVESKHQYFVHHELVA